MMDVQASRATHYALTLLLYHAYILEFTCFRDLAKGSTVLIISLSLTATIEADTIHTPVPLSFFLFSSLQAIIFFSKSLRLNK